MDYLKIYRERLKRKKTGEKGRLMVPTNYIPPLKTHDHIQSSKLKLTINFY